MKFTPKYDKDFLPINVQLENYERDTNESNSEKLWICVERSKGYNYVYKMRVFKDEAKKAENIRIAERMIKAILWVAGGYKIYVCGPEYIYETIKADYSLNGKRAFDYDFMSGVYETPMQVEFVSEDNFPCLNACQMEIGGNYEGYRIGFDAGGSDRKVSAVCNGEVLYSEEVVWNPKLNSDYHYHINGIKDSILRAASKMPRVDAIGVSTAGVCIDNKVMVSSLFVKIPKEYFHSHVKNMYIDIAKELNIPIEVANDGDVTALAGAMELNDSGVLGIAMGTSEAGGYINTSGNLNGWISELAFVPVDMNEKAMQDEWSGDIGCGVKYFSQDAVIKLGAVAGIDFSGLETPAEKLKRVQGLCESGDERAKAIFEDIGIYLGYTIPFYARFYEIKHLLLLGRVTSGKGGEIIIKKALEVLNSEYPNITLKMAMPDESNRRVGQSIAAATLTAVEKR